MSSAYNKRKKLIKRCKDYPSTFIKGKRSGLSRIQRERRDKLLGLLAEE